MIRTKSTSSTWALNSSSFTMTPPSLTWKTSDLLTKTSKKIQMNSIHFFLTSSILSICRYLTLILRIMLLCILVQNLLIIRARKLVKDYLSKKFGHKRNLLRKAKTKSLLFLSFLSMETMLIKQWDTWIFFKSIGDHRNKKMENLLVMKRHGTLEKLMNWLNIGMNKFHIQGLTVRKRSMLIKIIHLKMAKSVIIVHMKRYSKRLKPSKNLKNKRPNPKNPSRIKNKKKQNNKKSYEVN